MLSMNIDERSNEMFRELELDDISWIKDRLNGSCCYSCDYSPFNLFAWKGTYSTEICEIDGFFVGRIIVDDKWLYLFPCGEGNLMQVIDKLDKQHNEDFDYPLMFMCNREQAEFLGDDYEKELRPGYVDYIYNAMDLIELKGSKYHGKRNHIAQFNKKYDWRFEALNSANLNDAKILMANWYNQSGADSYEEELVVLDLAVKYSAEFNIIGGLIYAEKMPVALAIGTCPGNDTLDVHIEKADTSFIGSYSKIMNEFAKYAYSIQKFSYINREEDMGIENLKKAKLSLHPAFLEEKIVCVKKL